MKELQLLLLENNTWKTMKRWIIFLGGTVPVRQGISGELPQSDDCAICNLSQYSVQFRAYCSV